MTFTGAVRTGILCVGALFLGARPVVGASGELVDVFIDAREPAYVIYQGVSIDASPAARQEMVGYTGLEGVSMVTWAQFRRNVQNYVAAAIVKNEYPAKRTAPGLLAVLKAYPGRPVAVTWNGGMATSFFDFQHAVEVFADFQENASRYEQNRLDNAANDPLNPDIQIRVLLGG